MGHQRYLAESLMEHFLLTEDEAYRLTPLIEKVEYAGDDFSDAIWNITEHGNLEEAPLSVARKVLGEIGTNIDSLERELKDVRKRKNDE